MRDFVRWAAAPDNPAAKRRYYPNIAKSELLSLGYIAPVSSHSRGSSVDLTLTQLDLGVQSSFSDAWLDDGELDTGTPFDFFDLRSHTLWEGAAPAVRAHRILLRDLMAHGGFTGIAQEWWHFTLVDEPYRAVSFDFPVA